MYSYSRILEDIFKKANSHSELSKIHRKAYQSLEKNGKYLRKNKKHSLLYRK